MTIFTTLDGLFQGSSVALSYIEYHYHYTQSSHSDILLTTFIFHDQGKEDLSFLDASIAIPKSGGAKKIK